MKIKAYLVLYKCPLGHYAAYDTQNVERTQASIARTHPDYVLLGATPVSNVEDAKKVREAFTIVGEWWNFLLGLESNK